MNYTGIQYKNPIYRQGLKTLSDFPSGKCTHFKTLDQIRDKERLIWMAQKEFQYNINSAAEHIREKELQQKIKMAKYKQGKLI